MAGHPLARIGILQECVLQARRKCWRMTNELIERAGENRAYMLTKSSAQGSAYKYDQLIRQVADSETFRSAPTMRALLLYLWEHQGASISEYAIATEALGRSRDFDPKLDSTVRV